MGREMNDEQPTPRGLLRFRGAKRRVRVGCDLDACSDEMGGVLA